MNNPVHGLTLTDRLEKHREEIIYGIKQAVGVGPSVGDNYTTMAKRIQTTLIGPDGAGGSYAKSVRIARTEAHRVRETGNLDAAQNLAEKLENAGYTMTKTWHTMKDERVRPQKRYKTKSGWKTGKPGKYNHVKMDGVTVPINEKFKLPSGAETMAPGQSGVAGEDINCRCYLSYEIAAVNKLKPHEDTDKIRAIDKVLNDPEELKNYTPGSLKQQFEDQGLEVKRLGHGRLKGIDFENGGGYRVNFSEDGVFQYHPANSSHHHGAYYKISTAKGGTKRYDLNGKEIKT